MESKSITNTANIINSKDLFARINWLEQQLNYRCSDEYSEELKALKVLMENVEAVATASTYEPGSDLVRDSYLEEYKSMEEPGKGNARFNPVDFGGVVYWLRH
ncbi:hypothetical protein [Nitrosovibrio sp. Nv6]|uniref:hypothetical protein n=1 Tax=Nitrosovibrio sp. Nv6 TaxID=1855340 RepID=UPI0008BC2C40|nr:hypothetical protein [Nitrosovibrio sp. Nv6]SEO60041.1 hypothetical protein SAMN05216316_0586 [Nitrosovibrio sp. Nv6]